MISVFTASHDPRFLGECFASLAAQTCTEWEWVVLLNNSGPWYSMEADTQGDHRVRVLNAGTEVNGVGAAKAAAVSHCRGEILVELDHDDLLAPEALEEVAHAFAANPDASLVYSDCRQIAEDGSPDDSRFDPTHGWRYGPDGTCLSLAPSPHNVSLIWYAPNHVRAFTRTAYDSAGGYDPAFDVLDDQDLMARLYQVGPFVHVAKCLYFQRMWANTQRQPETNARIQALTVELYDRTIEANALAWARRSGLVALDLGGVPNPRPGYLVVDKAPGADIQGDVFDVLAKFDDHSVGVIRAADFLEHVADKVRLMNELHRVLAHGGMLLSLTPSSDGRGAFQDPTHVSFWNENSFWYYTDASFARYVPEITARFQVSRLFTTHPTPWHAEHRIPYVCANLIALHEGPRQGGPLYW